MTLQQLAEEFAEHTDRHATVKFVIEHHDEIQAALNAAAYWNQGSWVLATEHRAEVAAARQRTLEEYERLIVQHQGMYRALLGAIARLKG
jgi:broad specificity phosphatase PhoE